MTKMMLYMSNVEIKDINSKIADEIIIQIQNKLQEIDGVGSIQEIASNLNQVLQF